MEISEVWDRLMAEGVGVWLDPAGQLRIDKGASAELKELVRRHKAEIAAVLEAHVVMNRSGVRIVRLPLGGLALAKPPGPPPAEVAEAIKTLRMDHMPLVHNYEGGRWLPYQEWVRQQVLDFSKPLCDPEELRRWLAEREAEDEARLRSRRRRTA